MGEIAELQRIAWETSESSGFHSRPRTVGDELALMHSELSEALEDYRVLGEESFKYREEPNEDAGFPKPEGFGAELADCIIRILDAAETHGIDLEETLQRKMVFNTKRSYRHGGKVL